MSKRNQARQQVLDETAELKGHLEETQETLDAIRQYMVDAFVVTRANGAQVVTLSDTDFPYRMMVESMNEGAVTLIPDGTIFYCNPHFGEMLQMECEKLVGVRFRDLIRPNEREAFDEALREARQEGIRRESCLLATGGKCVPVQLSIYQLTAKGTSGLSIIATDLTERSQAEEKIRSLASDVTKAEQEERQRISQILHDDLQQRLFAIKTQLTMIKANSQNNHNQLSSDLQVDLDQILRGLSDAISLTRTLSIDLSPVVLHGERLAEAIARVSSHMKEQHGLQVELETKGRFGQLDDEMRLLLFQTVRELLFNVVKHANTLEAKVTLEQFDNHGRITVSDTGKGFDVVAVMNDPQAVHGLLILQDRLSLMGCHMEVTSKPGHGTRAVIEIPIRNPSG